MRAATRIASPHKHLGGYKMTRTVDRRATRAAHELAAVIAVRIGRDYPHIPGTVVAADAAALARALTQTDAEAARLALLRAGRYGIRYDAANSALVWTSPLHTPRRVEIAPIPVAPQRRARPARTLRDGGSAAPRAVQRA